MSKRKLEIDSVARTSLDVASEQIERLKGLFPEVFSEGRVDFEKLRATLGEIVDDGPERYSFTWAGKRDAVRLLRVPSRATLKPRCSESVDWDSTKNVFIEGENLEVLKLLYKSYAGRAKMIYIDPPYNTGNDFVYPDDFADPLDTYLKLTGQKDTEGNLLTSNPETSGRYHSDWLTALYPRLFVARQLLSDEGVIFVSIDDHEVHNLRLVMNEIFGEESFAAQITVLNNPKGRGLREHFAVCHDYVLVYTKRSQPMGIPKTEDEVEAQYRHKEGERRYRLLELRNTHRQYNRKTRRNLWYPIYVDRKSDAVSLEPEGDTEEVLPVWDDGLEGCWTWGKDKVAREGGLLVGREVRGKWKVFRKAFGDDDAGNVVIRKLQTVWTGRRFHTEVGQAEFDQLIPGRVFEAPKPVGLIKEMLLSCTDPDEDDIVVDFYAGSGTTGHALLDANAEDGGHRRFVLVQLQEPTPESSNARDAGFATIAAICKERIHRAIEKLKSEARDQKELFRRGEAPEDRGFRVFKLTESNYRQWRGVKDRDGNEYAEEMELFTDPLVPGWSAEDVVWEVALKEGYDLSSTVEEVKGVKGNCVWEVADPYTEQSFHICLDDEIRDSTVRALKLGREALFVCRDAALTDEQAANLALTCRLKTI